MRWAHWIHFGKDYEDIKGMDKNTIIQSVGKKICQDILRQPDKVLKADEALITSGVIDSFSLVDLALIVENLYSVRIEDYELNSDTFDTLNQLAEMIIDRS